MALTLQKICTRHWDMEVLQPIRYYLGLLMSIRKANKQSEEDLAEKETVKQQKIRTVNDKGVRLKVLKI